MSADQLLGIRDRKRLFAGDPIGVGQQFLVREPVQELPDRDGCERFRLLAAFFGRADQALPQGIANSYLSHNSPGNRSQSFDRCTLPQ
jgi:hypothetical protein